MSKKKVEITIGGMGHEIARSKFTCEEIEKIKKHCEETDSDMEAVFTNGLDEVLEDRGDWYECDDLGHFMGGNLSCIIYITIDGKESQFKTDETTIELKSRDYPTFDDGVVISFVTWEKGTVESGDFEINENEEFDIKKLKLLVNQIETTDSIYDLIQELRYDGEPINGDGFSDTTGKAFDVEIDECYDDE